MPYIKFENHVYQQKLKYDRNFQREYQQYKESISNQVFYIEPNVWVTSLICQLTAEEPVFNIIGENEEPNDVYYRTQLVIEMRLKPIIKFDDIWV